MVLATLAFVAPLALLAGPVFTKLSPFGIPLAASVLVLALTALCLGAELFFAIRLRTKYELVLRDE
ncbi:hypothetical protein CDL60_17975 [Roseateles noduli]|nr:hypothetical protein CDL60_17975 [Roseateles noduli]